MLRIIVISLVVANLLLLGFQSSTPTAKPEAKPKPAVSRGDGIPTIHLFSEMMQDQGLLSGNRRCFTLGPFHSIADWDEVHMRLEQVSTNVSERQTEALVEKGYWVYMPPYPSLLEANEALLSLQALGLKDLAIMYDGEWKNSISLGYFMRQENAQRRKKSLESKGYAPMIRIQRQAEPRYWLDYEQQPGAGLVMLDMQKRPNDFMQRPVPCPEAEFPEAEAVASTDPVESTAPPQTPGEDANPVTAGEKGLDTSGSTEQSAQAPDQTGDNVQEADPEPTAGQDAGKPVEIEQAPNEGTATGSGGENEPEAAEEPVETPNGSVEVATDKPVVSGADSGTEPPLTGEPRNTTDDSAKPESGPIQTVGTGPAYIGSEAPEPAETRDIGQDGEIPPAGAAENNPADGGEQSADDSEENTAAEVSGDSAEKEKDSGNGSIDGR